MINNLVEQILGNFKFMQLVTTCEIIFVLEDRWLCLCYLLCPKIDCIKCYLGVFTWYKDFFGCRDVTGESLFFLSRIKIRPTFFGNFEIRAFTTLCYNLNYL